MRRQCAPARPVQYPEGLSLVTARRGYLACVEPRPLVTRYFTLNVSHLVAAAVFVAVLAIVALMR